MRKISPTKTHTLAFAGGNLAWICESAPYRIDPAQKNQDAVGAFPIGENRGVCVVLDGAGGAKDGARASQLALKEIKRALSKVEQTDRLRTALLDGIEAADRAVRDQCPGGAATLAAVMWNEEGLRTFSIGDARVLWVGGGGRIKYANVQHGPVGYAIEAGLLEPEAAMEHDERHVISNALGGETTHLELAGPFKVQPRDRVLLASDGLTDNLLEADIAKILKKGKVTQSLQRLAEWASEKMQTEQGKPDDLSIMVWGPR